MRRSSTVRSSFALCGCSLMVWGEEHVSLLRHQHVQRYFLHAQDQVTVGKVVGDAHVLSHVFRVGVCSHITALHGDVRSGQHGFMALLGCKRSAAVGRLFAFANDPDLLVHGNL
jgi:hypothetical protein